MASDLEGAVGELRDTTEGLADEARRLRTGLRHNRALIIAVAVLAVFTGGVAVQAHHANTAARANRAALTAACRSANEARVQSVQLWEHIVNVSPQPTAEQKRQATDFLAYVHKVYAARHCG